MTARALLQTLLGRLLSVLARLACEPVGIYRPEAHYMRGPGPAWRAKHR